MPRCIDISRLLDYFNKLSVAINSLYPEDLLSADVTDDNIFNYNYDLSFLSHPNWVRVHFPLELIYYREKAGKLRKSKSMDVMYQNNFNVLSQLVIGPDDFGIHYRKNKHKGYSIIIGAIKIDIESCKYLYGDRVKPEKFKNFREYQLLKHPEDLKIKAFCEVLDDNLKCDSIGQLRLFK